MYAWDDRVSDQLSLILGFVGPVALAEPAQTFIHRLTGADEPQGWDNQLQQEKFGSGLVICLNIG
jgi:hypothetical protein